MKINQVAAQLWTCRDTLQDAAGVARTFARLREIGYTTVQASGIAPSVPYKEVAKMLADNGMTCCATHEGCEDILDSPQKVVDLLGDIGCKITAYPYPGGVDLASRPAVDAWIKKLQAAGEVLQKAGQILCYHNHNMEFRKLDGKTILDLVYEGTTPALQGEPDTYWVQYGGGDNIAWCEKLADRMPIMHLKDYYTTPENTPAFCEIGAGVLNFTAIIAAAEASGCEWFAVEQDVCPGDPIESLAQSFRYIEENLVS